MTQPVKGMRAFSTQERRVIRAKLLKKYGSYCQICLSKGRSRDVAAIDMSTRMADNSFSVDHVLALADGGSNTIDNMMPTHRLCNNKKGSKVGRHGVSAVTGPRLAYTSSSC
jgi:5-methylcytosine-specific restriction endonuclease McrA